MSKVIEDQRPDLYGGTTLTKEDYKPFLPAYKVKSKKYPTYHGIHNEKALVEHERFCNPLD